MDVPVLEGLSVVLSPVVPDGQLDADGENVDSGVHSLHGDHFVVLGVFWLLAQVVSVVVLVGGEGSLAPVLDVASVVVSTQIPLVLVPSILVSVTNVYCGHDWRSRKVLERSGLPLSFPFSFPFSLPLTLSLPLPFSAPVLMPWEIFEHHWLLTRRTNLSPRPTDTLVCAELHRSNICLTVRTRLGSPGTLSHMPLQLSREILPPTILAGLLLMELLLHEPTDT